MLVGFTAAIGQAPITAVLLRAGDSDIAAAIRQQVLPLADVTQLVRDEVFPLNRVPALVAGPAAVAQVKLDLPRNGLFTVLNLEKVPISHRPLFLLEGAAEEVNQREPENQGEHPALAQETAPQQRRKVQHPGAAQAQRRPRAASAGEGASRAPRLRSS